MVKEILKTNGSEEMEADLYEIFMDNGTSQLEKQLLKSKRKLLNAKRGKNELFEVLKLKLKGLDMIILILQNNKNIIKSEDIYCLDTLSKLLKLAKNEKSLFEPIAKKIKTIVTLILKNQILLNKEEKFEEIIKFIIDIMNIHFEPSFLQQIVDKIKTHEKLFEIFTSLLFTKFFIGRNVSMKVNDMKHVIKYTMITSGPFYFYERLIKFLVNRENGGARTTHQITQVFNLLTYTTDLAVNKLKDENAAEFRTKFISLDNQDMLSFGKKVLNTIKENLKAEEKTKEEKTKKLEEKIKVEKVEEETDLTADNNEITEITEVGKKTKGKKQKKQKKNTKAKKENSSFFFVGIINFYDRYVSFLKKTNLKLSESEKNEKNVKSVASVLEKITEDFELKNMQKKITEIKEKVFSE